MCCPICPNFSLQKGREFFESWVRVFYHSTTAMELFSVKGGEEEGNRFLWKLQESLLSAATENESLLFLFFPSKTQFLGHSAKKQKCLSTPSHPQFSNFPPVNRVANLQGAFGSSLNLLHSALRTVQIAGLFGHIHLLCFPFIILFNAYRTCRIYNFSLSSLHLFDRAREIQ